MVSLSFRLLPIAALVALLIPLKAGAADGPGSAQTENPLRLGLIPNQVLTEGMPPLRIPVEVSPADGTLRLTARVTGNPALLRPSVEPGGGRWYLTLRAMERTAALPARASVTLTALSGVHSNAVSFHVTVRARDFLPYYRLENVPQWGSLISPFGEVSAEVSWVDVDRDGFPDAVVPGTQQVVLRPRLQSVALSRVPYGPVPPLQYAGSRWTDLDGDGLVDSCAWQGRFLDVLITGLLPGGTTFVRRPHTLPALEVAGAGFLDLDGNGTQDLVYTGTVGGVPRVVTALNDGAGDLMSVSNALPPFAGPVVSADFNRDGRWDLLLADGMRRGTPAQVYYNQGGLVFAPGPRVSGLDPVTSAGSVDVNGDGRPDLWLVQAVDGNRSNLELRVLVQEGGQFTEVLHIPAGEFRGMGSPGWGDFDHDGRVDLVAPWAMPMPNLDGTPGSTNVVMLYRNRAGGRFEPERFLFLASPQVNVPGGGPHSFVPSPADLDQDGDLDLMGYDIMYRPFYNMKSTPNPAPDVPEGFRAFVLGNDLFLFWSGARDGNQETPTSFNVRVGTRPGANDVVPSNSLADGTRQLTAVGNAGFTSFYTMKIPRRDLEQLYCSVQAIDASFAGGPFAPEVRIPIAPFGNLPPVIEAPTEIQMNEDESAVVRFSVTDDRTRLQDLDIAAWAEGAGPFVPQQLVLTRSTGAGDGRWQEFTLRPSPNRHGQGWIHVVARDRNQAASTNRIAVFVRPVNDIPSVQLTLPGLYHIGGTAEGTIRISDLESPAEQLRVTVESSNPDLLPPSRVTLTGDGLVRSIRARPVDSREGSAMLTFRVTDPEGGESRELASLVWRRQVLEPDPAFDWAAHLLDVMWVDFNRDGSLDGVGYRESGAVEVWTQGSDGTFVRSSEASLGHRIDALQILDLDGDGAPDLLVASHWPNTPNGRLHVLWNDAGAASRWTALGAATGLTTEVLLDADADGDLDVVAGHDRGEIRLLKNAPGAFRSVTIPSWEPLNLVNPDLLRSEGEFRLRLDVADVNQDGRSDLMVSKDAGPVPAVHRVLLQSATGSFEVIRPHWGGRWGGTWVWLGAADFDNDGRHAFLLRNDAEGAALPIHVAEGLVATGGIPMTVASPPVGDLDGDGYTDVFGVVRNPPGAFGLVSRVGGNPVFHPQRPLEFRLNSISAGDVDRDGTLELWVRTPAGSRLLRNPGVISNQPPSTPSGLRLRQVEPGVLEVSWNASVDAEQSGGLTYNVRLGTASGKDDVVSSLALSDGRGLVPAAGNAGARTRFQVRGAELGRTYHATVQAVDAGFARSSFAAEVSLTVDGLPTLSGLSNFSLPRSAGAQVTSFTIGDLETPADQLQVSVESSNPVLLPASRINLTGSGSGRVLEFQTKPNWAGVATVRIRVTDGSGNTVERAFDVFVPNPTPYAVEIERIVEVPDNAATVLRLDDFDPDGDFLEYSIPAGPSHGRLEGTGPEVVFHPDSGFTGEDSFRFLAMTPGSFPASGRVVLRVVPGHRLRPDIQFDASAAGPGPRLRVRGRPGANVRLEHSADLKRWEAERDWVIPGNEVLDVEPEPPADAAARFYRVVTEP